MYGPNNRAQYRDDVRRSLGQVPPIDDGTGIAGALPPRWPWLTNADINMRLNWAVAWLSRKSKAAGDPVPRSIPIAGQAALGPFQINLQMLSPFGSTNAVWRAAWINGGNTQEQPLAPGSRKSKDRDKIAWATQQPAQPIEYWQEFGSLLLWPAPQSAGTLTLMLGRALWSQSQDVDAEMVDLIPNDYLNLVTAQTTSYCCAMAINDIQYARIQKDMDRIVADGLPDLKEEIARRNRAHQARLTAQTGRTGMVSGRR